MNHKIQLTSFAAFAALVIAALGCDAPELPKPAAAPPAPPTEAVAAEPVAAPATDVGPNGTVAPPMANPVTHAPRPFTANDPIEGRRSQAAGGYLGSVGHANFYARHQIIINQINEALALFNASGGINGGWPKSHEEFMEQIVKANNIHLPKLDDPVEYIFVPEDGAKGLQIRLRDDYPGDIWPPGATLDASAQENAPAYEQPNQPSRDAGAAPQGETQQGEQPAEQPADSGDKAPPTDRAIGVRGVGAAAGVAPTDLLEE